MAGLFYRYVIIISMVIIDILAIANLPLYINQGK